MLLKHTLTFCVLILISATLSAQKPGLVKARYLQTEGNLTEALKEVETVLADPDTSGIGGAWFTYGEIHKGLFESSDVKEEQEYHILEALKGYKNTRLYQPKKTRLYLLADQLQVQLYEDLVSKGSALFQERRLQESANSFELASVINPQDSIVLQYAASISMEAGLYDRAIDNYKKLVRISPRVSTYQSIIGIQKDRMKDDSLTLITIEEARKAFPDQYVFKRYELDIYLKTQENQKARELLAELCEEYPTNAQFAIRLAVMNEEVYKEHKSASEPDSVAIANAFETAAASYTKAIELNPRDLIGNFNLAMMYTERANDYYQQLNNLTLTELKEKAEGIEQQAMSNISLAIPLMETAHTLQPTNPDVLKSLRSYYDRLGNGTKKLEIENIMREQGIRF